MRQVLKKWWETLRSWPVVGPLLDILDNASTIGAILFFALGAFLSYVDWVAPAYRDEAVRLSFVLGVCSYIGFTLLDIAYYFANRYREPIYDLIGDAIDEGEAIIEDAVDKDVIPTWAKNYVKTEAQQLFDEWVAKHPPSVRLEARVAELEAQLGRFVKS